jgi:2-amino-4-hydroxy-6-hydroxymethyldihydropteridine diphosphokinase
MPDVYVGVGSNEDAEEQLRRAVAALEMRFGPVRRSSVYRGAATGAPAPDYSNLVVGFSTSASLGELLAALAEIERLAGRVRGSQTGVACPLDLDLLLYGRLVDAEARIPRAEIRRRAYVREPLAEVAPAILHPVTGEAMG